MALQTATVMKSVAHGGLIREDVMDKIWDISKIPLPLTDMIGEDSADNSYTEWTEDALQAVDTSNAHLDGADAPATDDNSNGKRVGNHCQISIKYVRTSTRAEASKKIGRSNELGYQVMMRQRELKRDVEAIMLTQQASRADNGTLAGLSAGLGAWLETNTYRSTGGSDGGFSSGVVSAPTNGTASEALTEVKVRDIVQSIYNEGGDPSVMMSIPSMISKFSSYLFTSSARIATLQSDQGKAAEAATALGAINVFVTDFGTLELVPNRIMQATAADRTEVYIMDPSHLRQAFLSGYKTDAMAKTGLSEKRLMHVDWTLKVLNEKAQGIIADCDQTADVTYNTP